MEYEIRNRHTRVCSCCKRELPVEKFYSFGSKRCISCSREANRRSYKKRKASSTLKPSENSLWILNNQKLSQIDQSFYKGQISLRLLSLPSQAENKELIIRIGKSNCRDRFIYTLDKNGVLEEVLECGDFSTLCEIVSKRLSRKSLFVVGFE